jgi:hypothetical protein
MLPGSEGYPYYGMSRFNFTSRGIENSPCGNYTYFSTALSMKEIAVRLEKENKELKEELKQLKENIENLVGEGYI